jgi:AraC-like DNA-binding protein
MLALYGNHTERERKMQETINIAEGIKIIKTINESEQNIKFNTNIRKLNIQLHFSLSGETDFRIIKGTHRIQMNNDLNSLFYFNPRSIIPIDAIIKPNSQLVSILFSLNALHKLLDEFSIDFSFFHARSSQKKLYSKRLMTPNEVIVVNQIFKRKNNSKFDAIYLKAKIMELISYYFDEKTVVKNDDTCPNLRDQRNVAKIKKARQLLIENINDPSTIDELADEIKLSVNILKKGFKKIYGEPIFKYLLNYKLELARQLLLSGEYSVKEVAYEMGYSTPTHFIVAFKKKFGITPKKYMQG